MIILLDNLLLFVCIKKEEHILFANKINDNADEILRERLRASMGMNLGGIIYQFARMLAKN